MVNKYYQKGKKSLGKEYAKYIKILLKKKKKKGKEGSKKDIKIY